MGFLDEMKEAYQEGYDGADKVLGKFDKPKEKNADAQTTNEESQASVEAEKVQKPKRKITVASIVGTVVLGAIGFFFLGPLGLVVGAAIGFFCGGFLFGLIKKAIPEPFTEKVDIFGDKDKEEEKK